MTSRASLRFAILLFALVIAAVPAFAQPSSDTLERRPRFFGAPPVDCVVQGDPYSYTIGVLDSNFFTLPNGNEEVTLTVVGPDGFTVAPTSISGPRSNDSVTVVVSSSAVNAPVGKLWITLAARDSKGRTDTMRYYISVSRRPAFIMPVFISAYDGERDVTMSQTLYLGIDTVGDATSGYEEQLGQLDTFYCEYELPPLPPSDIFDARWRVIARNGLIRSIYPAPTAPGDTLDPWIALIQLGTTGNGTPVSQPTISWSAEDAERFNIQLQFRDLRGDYFSVNMATGEYHEEEPTLTLQRSGDTISTMLPEFTRQGFQIVASSVLSGIEASNSSSSPFGILSIRPNPLRSGSTIRYSTDRPGTIAITITDVQGRTIRRLSAEKTDAGEHTVHWDGTNDAGIACADGTYFCRMESEGRIVTRRVIVGR